LKYSPTFKHFKNKIMQDLEYITAILFVFVCTITPILILSVIADYITKRLKNKNHDNK